MDVVSGRFDDLRAGTAWVFGTPDRVVTANRLGEVVPALTAVDEATRGGAWAWGYVSYEAAPAFDPALRVRPPAPHGPPLACFAIGAPPRSEPAIGPPATTDARAHDATCSWQVDWSPGEHGVRVGRVRAAIAGGEAYQVNLTTRLRSTFRGDPLALYAALAHAQRGAYNAYLDLAPDPSDDDTNHASRYVVVSASPELFFGWDGRGLTTRPMKGTARRGSTNDEDELARLDLLASAKQRAENVMIVDLLRNDLSRLAETGSVRVESLLDAERYETVWQLTSTVTARPRPDVGLADVFAALFPCGSVTGAPKAAAMGLVAELETSPRGLYCGAVGMLAPPGSPFRARFSVPIRTAVIDRSSRAAVYGTGGGITWASDPDDEYDELLAKAAILDHPNGPVQLLETLRFTPGAGLRNLDRHLARLLDSARYFDIPADPAAIRTRVEAAAATFPADGTRRVRLLLDRAGQLRVQHTPLPAGTGAPVRLALDTCPTVTGRWTRHKTTRRDHYDAAAARHPDAEDVILLDRSGHVLETTRASLAVRLDGSWCTPPLARGCLPGVERQRLIEAGRLRERDLHADDLRPDGELAVLSSLRGWRAARLR